MNEDFLEVEKAYKQKSDKIKQSIYLYESLLSMRCEQTSDYMKWIFTNVDPYDPERECYFVISKEAKEIIETNPTLCKIEDLANKLKHKTFSVFIIHVRKMFKELCEKEKCV